MKEFFTKFFKNKKNVVLITLIGVALIGLLIASFWNGFVPFSCMLFGILCIYVSYLLLLHFTNLRSRKLDEFISEEDKYKKKKTKFLDNENKISVMMLTGLSFIMGCVLIYYGISALIV